MSRLIFPPVSVADESGLIGIGGEATIENLLQAYRLGIFPWPWSDEYLAWFSPPLRGVLFFDAFHVGRSLKKFLSRNPYEFAINKNFSSVIQACAEATNRKKQKGTWITSEMVNSYIALHEAGFATSYESYLDGNLVGGLYGVRINGYFSGESMFYSEENASKAALVFAVSHLQSEGLTWMDCQVITDTTKQFGASEIKRDLFIKLLNHSINFTS
jgi:leucyl/phenylalanyl-tRNA--protein transferase